MLHLRIKIAVLILLAALFLQATLFLPTAVLASPAQDLLILTDEGGEYPLGRRMDILEDPTGELTLEDVASPEYAASFIPSDADVPIYGYTDSIFWLRLPLRNEATLTELWLLEVNFPNLNYVDLYLPLQGGGYQVRQSGGLRPFDTRDIPYYHVVFEVPLAYQAEQTIYIRVESGSSMTLAFTLWSPVTFTVNKFSDMLGIGLFYGALLIALAYQLFVYFSLREPNYLNLILVIASSIVFWAAYEGVADQFLWPGLSQQKLPLLAITMSLFFMACLRFSDGFLEQKTKAPRVHLLIYILIGLWGLMILIVPFFSFGFMAQVSAILIFLTTGILAWVGIYNWSKGNRLARFYVISWLGYILGMMTVELVRSGLLQSTLFTEKAYHIGLIWLVLMWSLALADRINQLKTETENANRKLTQSEHKLSQTLDWLPLGVAVYGPQRKPTYVNQRAIDLLSNPQQGIIADVSAGRTLSEAMKYFTFRLVGSDQSYPLEKMPISQAFEGQTASVDDIEADLVDRRVSLEIWANPVKDEQGSVESVVVAFQDITERRQAQAEIEEYRHRLERLVEQRTAELSATNERLQFENAERQRLEEMLRLRLEWLVAVNQVNQTIMDTSELPEAYQKFTQIIQKLFGANDAFLAEMDAQAKQITLLAHTCRDTAHSELTGILIQLQYNGLANWHFESGMPIVITRDQLIGHNGPVSIHYQQTQSQYFIIVPQRFGDAMIGVLGLEFIETERLFSANEIALLERVCLDISQVRDKGHISEQTQALIAAEERNRLARDLHDSVTQVLFSASLIAEVLPQIWRRDPQRAQASLDELHRLTRGALAEMRTMLLELRPASLVKTSLSDLLTQLTQAAAGRTGLSFQLLIEQTPPLPEEVHVGFYRIAQESLNNIIKHAQASQVTVSLNATPMMAEQHEAWIGEVKLMIQNDGPGFSVQERESLATQNLGLTIMRERAAAIQAILKIESRPGQGTTVTLTWHN